MEELFYEVGSLSSGIGKFSDAMFILKIAEILLLLFNVCLLAGDYYSTIFEELHKLLWGRVTRKR